MFNLCFTAWLHIGMGSNMGQLFVATILVILSVGKCDFNAYEAIKQHDMDGITSKGLLKIIHKAQENAGCQTASCKCDVITTELLDTRLGLAENGTFSELQVENAFVLALYLIANEKSGCQGLAQNVDTKFYIDWMRNFEKEELGNNFVKQVEHLVEHITEHYKQKTDDNKSDHDDHDEHDHDDHDEHDHDDDHDEEDHHHEEEACFTPAPQADLYNCFNYVIVLGAHKTGPANDDVIRKTAARLVYSLYKGKAHQADCDKLPTPKGIVDDVWLAAGTKNKAELTDEGLDKLLSKLNLGHPGAGVDEHKKVDPHAGHGHRRRRRDTDEHKQCFTSSDLYQIYGLKPQSALSRAQFTTVCPSLVQQLLEGAYKASAKNKSVVGRAPTNREKYGWGFLAVLIVSLCSTVGAVIIPFMSTSARNFVLSPMIGLAVGTLCGDAVLHLIPLAFGIHGDHAHDASAPIVVEPFVFRSLGLLGGLYIFFAFESLLSAFKKNEVKGKDYEVEESKEKTYLPLSEVDSVAWMVIVGDMLHNLADGLAIGAAFSVNRSGGVATSLAVFCHELPHELGDFAVLLHAGMRPLMALLFNFLSACTAIIGFFIAITVATSSEVQAWILTCAAGMFLYVALSDMLPELFKLQKKKKAIAFILQTIGILLGVGVMLIIVIYESKIHI